VVGPDSSPAWLGLFALAAFIALGIVAAAVLVSYECEARHVRRTLGGQTTALDLVWVDFTTKPD
jgi:hypothetical protein